MQIKVNKEVKEYTENIFLGLSMRQLLFSIMACIIALVIYFLTIDSLGIEITSWLCIIGALPFATLGFITYQQMTAEELFMTVVLSFLLSRRQLISNPYNLYHEMFKDYLEKSKKEAISKNVKKLRKIKISK